MSGRGYLNYVATMCTPINSTDFYHNGTWHRLKESQKLATNLRKIIWCKFLFYYWIWSSFFYLCILVTKSSKVVLYRQSSKPNPFWWLVKYRKGNSTYKVQLLHCCITWPWWVKLKNLLIFSSQGKSGHQAKVL